MREKKASNHRNLAISILIVESPGVVCMSYHGDHYTSDEPAKGQLKDSKLWRRLPGKDFAQVNKNQPPTIYDLGLPAARPSRTPTRPAALLGCPDDPKELAGNRGGRQNRFWATWAAWNRRTPRHAV
jgi:hypothetical protein